MTYGASHALSAARKFELTKRSRSGSISPGLGPGNPTVGDELTELEEGV